MPSFDDLRDVLVDCKIVSEEQWEQAVRHAGNVESLGALLAALEATTPWWWDHRPPAPPGLTDYQMDAIHTRFDDDKLHRIRSALVMNQFLLLDHLGEGGQGRVYRGRQLRPSRDVAIKILTHDTEDRRKRFEQEARAMMQVRHPAVARCYMFERLRQENGDVTDDYLIALEFIDGIDLQRMVRREGPVPWRFAVWWVAQLLEGLSHVHAGGFIHRDVKPENIMIVGPLPEPGVAYESTAAKLLDLGAAKPVGSESDGITRQGIFIGTPEYAPPEQWDQSQTLSPASDVYALGGTMFYALTGRSPYQRPVRDALAYLTSHMSDPVPNIREHNPVVPAEVNTVFRKMMAKDPAERGSAVELAAELRGLLDSVQTPRTKAKARDAVERRASSGSGPNPTPTKPPPTPRPKRDAEDGGGLLGFFERFLLPADQRASSGDLSAGERIAALIRRPRTILLFVLLIALLVWCVW
jgi:serine/threonine protein kinase